MDDPPASASPVISNVTAVARPSDAWFRSVVEAANEGIWIIDLDARTIFANDRMARMLGTSADAMIGLSPFDFLSDADRKYAADVMSQNFDGVSVEFEIRFQRPDGSEIAVLGGSAPLRDERGRITGSVATFSDLTARQESERQREEQRSEFHTLADNIPTLCWMAYADGHIYWYNRRWYEYTGTSPQDQAGWGWESVHHPDVLPSVVERWQHSLNTGETFEMTFPLRGADGQFRPFLTRVVPIRAEDGQIERWFGTNTNVDDLTRAQEAARASEVELAHQVAELNALYSSAPIGLAFFDREYRYLRVNDELAAINGVPAAEHIGRTISDVLADNAPAVEPIIDQVFATGEPVRDLEVSGETPQQPGILRHWLTGFYPVKDADSNVGAVGIWVVEISERKAAEDRERLLAREVDHRAKNLLAVVQSIVQLSRAESVAELKEGLTGRIQSLGRAHSLLADSRWEGVDFKRLVEEELAPFVGEQPGSVNFAGPPLILRPSAAQSLALVLHELTTNAVKYGAFFTGGWLDLTWGIETRDGAGTLAIDWVEKGLTGLGEPKQSGFGSRLITTSIERQLRGRIQRNWADEGLRCEIRIPAEHAVVGTD